MIDWNKAAVVFPGQNSQEVGMGADLAQTYPEAAAVFEEADAALGYAVSELCWRGPAEQLDLTQYTQPALFTTCVAFLRAFDAALGAPRPAFLAGHSLGEITALVAAGSLRFADGLHLVAERGRLMHEAGETNPGSMAAVLGADVATVEAACAQAAEETGAPAVLANDNCPGQLVIAGAHAALDRAVALLKEGGVKRIIPLAVSVAGHSPLLANAAAQLRDVLGAIDFSPPAVPVVANTSAAPLTDAGAIRAELAAQLTSRVRWTESVQAMRAAGVETFIEIGPKDVLTKLLRRIDDAATGVALNSAEALRQLAREHAAG
ncbi:MAG: ACP S-malonyltransferase [Anaerolineae bacterium]